jgi:hypothetical protein
MLFDKDGNIVIITQEKLSVVELVKRMTETYHRLKSDNVVVNLTTINPITLEELIEFLRLSNKHRSQKLSFVIVTDKVDLDEVPDELVVVPTLQEAYDIIEMEEIERDLGF